MLLKLYNVPSHHVSILTVCALVFSGVVPAGWASSATSVHPTPAASMATVRTNPGSASVTSTGEAFSATKVSSSRDDVTGVQFS